MTFSVRVVLQESSSEESVFSDSSDSDMSTDDFISRKPMPAEVASPSKKKVTKKNKEIDVTVKVSVFMKF